jgi:hypothetical protein
MPKISDLSAVSSLDGSETFPVVQGGATKKATIDDLLQPRQTWAAAGGSAPSLGATDLGGGATPVTLGSGVHLLSSFNRIGVECFATARIHCDGTNTAGVGSVTLAGLPVPPKYQGSGTDGGQNVGYGFIIDGTDFTFHPLRVVIDPFYHETEPLLFMSADVDGTPGSFLSGTILAHDDFPVDFGEAFYLNVTLQYEGDLG